MNRFREWTHSWWVTFRYGSRFTKAGRTLRRNLNDPIDSYVELGPPDVRA